MLVPLARVAQDKTDFKKMMRTWRGWAVSPAHGEYRVSLIGSMAMPSPIAPLANTASGTLASVSTGPLSGALRVSSLLLLCMARSHRLDLGFDVPGSAGRDLLILF